VQGMLMKPAPLSILKKLAALVQTEVERRDA
jgi:hypothetical protein